MGMIDPAKDLKFRASSLDDLRAFPVMARREAGYQLDRVQAGHDPSDWKSMSTIGQGVREIRIRDKDGAFRVMYVAKFEAAILCSALLSEKIAGDSQSRPEFSGKPLSRFGEGVNGMSYETFSNVWDAIEDTPAEAENMKLRSSLMMALERHIKAQGWTQAEAARRLHVTQPRVSDLMRGKIDVFGIDSLVNMLTAAGLQIEVRIAEAA